jgi:hypothetical protein
MPSARAFFPVMVSWSEERLRTDDLLVESHGEAPSVLRRCATGGGDQHVSTTAEVAHRGMMEYQGCGVREYRGGHMRRKTEYQAGLAANQKKEDVKKAVASPK